MEYALATIDGMIIILSVATVIFWGLLIKPLLKNKIKITIKTKNGEIIVRLPRKDTALKEKEIESILNHLNEAVSDQKES